MSVGVRQERYEAGEEDEPDNWNLFVTESD